MAESLAIVAVGLAVSIVAVATETFFEKPSSCASVIRLYMESCAGSMGSIRRCSCQPHRSPHDRPDLPSRGMTLVAHHLCPECGARYASDADSCALRFDALLALDHSRREPWGSRHGQAFAAYALQHPLRQCASLDLAWTALYRIYCLNEPAARVFATIRRRRASGATMAAGVPSRPAQPVAAPALTIADLSDFAAPTYATLLDAWCRATLAAWGATITVPTT